MRGRFPPSDFAIAESLNVGGEFAEGVCAHAGGWHDLLASLMVASGANVKVVQRQLGHASASMTLDVYADLFDDDLDVVRERLDAGLRAHTVTTFFQKHSEKD